MDTRGVRYEDEPSEEVYRWWKSTIKSGGEMTSLKFDMSNASSTLTPKVRVVRELERMAVLAASAGLDDLRHKLITYRAGDLWVPTGGICKEEMEIPPVITILLVGLSGSGKSSLVNLMYSVLGRAGIIPFAHTSPGTVSGFFWKYPLYFTWVNGCLHSDPRPRS